MGKHTFSAVQWTLLICFCLSFSFFSSNVKVPPFHFPNFKLSLINEKPWRILFSQYSIIFKLPSTNHCIFAHFPLSMSYRNRKFCKQKSSPLTENLQSSAFELCLSSGKSKLLYLFFFFLPISTFKALNHFPRRVAMAKNFLPYYKFPHITLCSLLCIFPAWLLWSLTVYVDSGQYGGVILSGFIAVSMHHIMQSQLGSWICYHCWLMRVTDLLFLFPMQPHFWQTTDLQVQRVQQFPWKDI